MRAPAWRTIIPEHAGNDNYGAIAFSSRSGAWGYSYNVGSGGDATQSANPKHEEINDALKQVHARREARVDCLGAARAALRYGNGSPNGACESV
jgi:hypothetical protein